MSSDDAPILSFDVGHVRIGVARAWPAVGIASPLTTLDHNDAIADTLTELLKTEQPQTIVIGLPRNLSGDDTAQTTYVREFTEKLQRLTAVPVVFQDEALTSQKAEAELKQRGKAYAKGEVDALAATYILEDYLQSSGAYHG